MLDKEIVKTCPKCKKGHMIKISREDAKIEPIEITGRIFTTISTTYTCDQCGHREIYVGK